LPAPIVNGGGDRFWKWKEFTTIWITQKSTSSSMSHKLSTYDTHQGLYRHLSTIFLGFPQPKNTKFPEFFQVQYLCAQQFYNIVSTHKCYSEIQNTSKCAKTDYPCFYLLLQPTHFPGCFQGFRGPRHFPQLSKPRNFMF